MRNEVAHGLDLGLTGLVILATLLARPLSWHQMSTVTFTMQCWHTREIILILARVRRWCESMAFTLGASTTVDADDISATRREAVLSNPAL
jgi:hypothetical protein